MLTVRPNQMETLASSHFEERTLPHLREFFPRHHAVLGDERLRQVIRVGLEKASSYELTTERNIRIYIDLMCLLGSGFDTDPQMPWAAKFLNARTEPENSRAEGLHAKALEYTDQVTPDYRRLLASSPKAAGIEEIQKLKHEPAQPVSPAQRTEFASGLCQRLQQVFPAKCRYLGEALVLKTVHYGIHAAEAYGIRIERGLILYVTLLFLVGAHFDTDPQVPWAGAVLNNPDLTDPVQRVDRLYAEAVSFLNRWFG